jgi:hypothetical protein
MKNGIESKHKNTGSMFLARFLGGESKRTEEQHLHFELGYVKAYNKYSAFTKEWCGFKS